MLREELVTMLDHATAARPSASADPPFLGFDESVDNPMLFAAVVDLAERGHVSGASPLWNKKRIRSNGSIVYVWGGVTRGVPISDFAGKEDAKHATWPDEWVVSAILAYLGSYDRLVLLSENTGFDRDGLRWLLRNVVDPLLFGRHDNRFSLTALFKKGKTNWPQYAGRVTQFIEAGRFEPGYSEVLF